MIDQNFPDIYAFGHGISTDKKKTLYAICPEVTSNPLFLLYV